MLSEEQIEKKKKRIELVVDTFLSFNNLSIEELSKELNIPKSTIQRDLNDLEYIKMVYSGNYLEILKQISDKLKQNKKEELSKGGINSTNINEPIRNNDGKFIGNKKR